MGLSAGKILLMGSSGLETFVSKTAYLGPAFVSRQLAPQSGSIADELESFRGRLNGASLAEEVPGYVVEIVPVL
jgi:hypothetical protein